MRERISGQEGRCKENTNEITKRESRRRRMNTKNLKMLKQRDKMEQRESPLEEGRKDK